MTNRGKILKDLGAPGGGTPPKTAKTNPAARRCLKRKSYGKNIHLIATITDLK
jgi:hypothetical protein